MTKSLKKNFLNTKNLCKMLILFFIYFANCYPMYNVPSYSDYRYDGKCFLCTPKEFSNILNDCVNSFKTRLDNDNYYSYEAYEFIKFEQKLSYIEYNLQQGNTDYNGVYDLIDSCGNLLNEYSQLNKVHSLLTSVHISESIEIIKNIRSSYSSVANSIKSKYSNSFYSSQELLTITKYSGISSKWSSLSNVDSCLDQFDTPELDFIFDRTEYHVTNYYVLNYYIFNIEESMFELNNYHLGFWLNLSLSYVRSGHTNVFDFIANGHKLSFILKEGSDGKSIDQIFKVGYETYIISNQAPCADLSFVSIHMFNKFDYYKLKIIIKSTYNNDRKYIEFKLPKSNIDNGDYFFNSKVLVKNENIYKLTFIKPSITMSEEHIVALQELELITKVTTKQIKLQQQSILNECSKIHPECLYYSEDRCYKCAENLVNYKGSCYQDCQDGFYYDSFASKCSKCINNCKSCSDKFTCNVCESNTYLYKNTCVYVCPLNTWHVNGVCLSCGEDCEICSSAYTCMKCKNKSLFQQKCVDNCPISYYRSETSLCKNCSVNCLVCSDSTTCIKCKDNYYLYENKCVDRCPYGYKIDVTNNICIKYATGCIYYLNEEICLICEKGYNLLDKKCISECPEGYVSINGICIKCDKNCKKCDSNNIFKCYECNDNLYLQNDRCVSKCYSGYFSDSSNVCTPCPENCYSCSSSNSCDYCRYEYYSYKGTCVKTCPGGYSGYGKDCVQCNVDLNCKTCFYGDQNTCKDCYEGYYLFNNECVEECDAGTFVENKTCKYCNPTCKICTNYETCVECKDGYFYKDGLCLLDCGQGFTKVDKKCVPCEVSNCKSCVNNPNECTSCYKDWILYNTLCLSNCPEGKYVNDLKCYNCLPNCSKCNDSSTCEKCKENFVLSSNPDSCSENCSPGFVNINGKCLSCNNNCLSCLPDRNTCTACRKGKYLLNGLCVDCPKGFIPDENTQTCIKCTPPCENCYKLPNHCLSCIDNYNLLPDNSCSDKCPEKTANIESKCISCNDNNCLICNNDLTTCLSCDEGFFLYNNICVQDCPEGTYADSTTKTCLNCSDNCKYCSNYNYCVNCNENYYLFNNICVDKCPNNYINQNINNKNICKKCTKNCTICSSLNNNMCLTCEDNYYLYQGQCTKICPINYFKNDINKTCDYCNIDNCSYCNDNYCITCDKGYLLHNGSCVKKCPLGYRSNGILCEKCLVNNCESCSINASTCQKCVENNYLISNNLCSSECPESFYNIKGTQVCANCLPNCLICNNNKNCQICKTGYYLDNNKNCVKECPIGYIENNINQNCDRCSINCKNCIIDNNNNNICKTCKEGYYLFNSTCLLTCPDGYFASEETKICNSCHSSCHTCNSSNFCLSCPKDMVLHNNTCFDSCPDYFVNIDGLCKECKTSSLCIKCDKYNIDECINCGQNILFNKRCLKECPPGYVNMNNNCISCPKNCVDCDYHTMCNKCSDLYVLYNGNCLQNCPNGYVKINGKCEKCNDNNCKECDTNKNCVKCNSEFFMKSDNNSNICVEECGIGYYSNGSKCFKCDNNCSICSSNNQCNLCINGYYLINNISCVEECPKGYVGVNGICEKCSNGCNLCSNNDTSICYKCIDNYYLLNGNCLNTCPLGYAVYSDRPGQCTRCCEKCEICCSSDPSKCRKCKEGYFLSVDNTCVKDCGPGFTVENNKCVVCKVKDCKDCTGNNLSCLSCLNDKALYDGKLCTNECPKGTYKFENECIPCNNCLTCEDNTGHCLSCKDGFFLTSTKICKTDCDDGKVKVGDECVPCIDVNCKECLNPSICKQCQEGYYLYNNKCYLLCPKGTYKSGSYCFDCDLNCENCLNSTTCLNCNDSYYLLNSKCVKNCGPEYNTYYGLCVPCDERCEFCIPDYKDKCMKCKEGYYLYNNKCIIECGIGNLAIQGEFGMECLPCTDNCKICRDRDTCEECNNNYYLLDRQCVSSCPNGYQIIGNKCERCNSPNCKYCPNNINECIECHLGTYLKDGKCVSNCGLGYYFDNNICRKCADFCLSCKGINGGECLDCKDNYYLHNNNCLEKCPEGYVSDSLGKCNKCMSENCLICNASDLNYCLICSQGYILNGKCLEICPLGYYGENGQCKRCSLNCKECYDYSVCYLCEEDSLMLGNVCVSECPLGFTEINKKCIKCNDSNCLKCQPDLETCNICKSPYVLLDNKCLLNCTQGYYSDGIYCNSCSSNCNKCTDKVNCIECSENSYKFDRNCVKTCPPFTYPKGRNCEYCLDSERCKQCDIENPENCLSCSSGILYNNKCINDCPIGTFYSNSLKTCLKCSDNCLSCLDENNCFVCKSNYILFDNQCLSNCPNNFVEVDSSCKKCGDNCLTCQTSNLQKCLSCKDGLYLYNNTCVSKCPKETYLDLQNNGSNKCLNCNPKCSECSSYSYCTECKDKYTLDNNTCKDECPEGKVSIDNTCYDCYDKNCSKCNSTKNNSCILCEENFLLSFGTCVSKCPKYYYPDFNDNTCKPCDMFCETCTNDNTCSSCRQGFYFIENTNKCINCSYPLVIVDEYCKKCDSDNCDRCLQGSISVCETCKYGFINFNGKCVENCPDNYYKDNNSCLPCKENCLTCTNKSICSKCKDNLFMYNGNCLKSCPDGYVDNSNFTCVKCEIPNCNYCDYNSLNFCLFCSPTHVQFNGLCLNQCPDGYMRDNKDNTCINCISNCKTCDNLNTCKTCKDGYYNYEGKCVNICPIKFYEDNTTKTCLPCLINNCKHCDKNICKICLEEYALFYENSLENISCIKECPEGYYMSQANGIKKCDKCDLGCVSCTDKNVCLKCDNLNYVMFEGKCLNECPNNYTIVNNKCIKCSNNCLECYPNKPNICTSCINGYLLNGKCLETCPKGFYASDNNMNCLKCDEKCSKCLSQDNCIECKPEFYLHNGSCINDCPKSMYSNLGKCFSCNIDNCDNCYLSSPNTTVCSDCSKNFYLYNNLCLNYCPKETYVDEIHNKCIDCDTGCSACNSSSCLSCKFNFYFYNNKCYSKCPDGTFNNDKNNTCELCLPECKTCYSNLPNSCIQCANNYVKNVDGSCSNFTSCGSFTYYDKSTNTCKPCKEDDCKTCNSNNNCIECDEGFDLIDNVCVENNKGNLIMCKEKVILLSPFSDLYNQATLYKLENYKLKTPSSRLNIIFHIRSLNSSKGTISKEKSFIFSYYFNEFKIDFIIDHKDSMCKCIISKGSDIRLLGNISCSSFDLFNWVYFLIKVNKDRDSNLILNIYKNKEKVFSTIIDYVENISSIIDKNSMLLFNSRSSNNSEVYQIGNIIISDFNVSSMLLNHFSIPPSNLEWANGIIPLDTKVDYNKIYKLIDYIDEKKHYSALKNFGMASYFYFDNMPNNNFSLYTINYPYDDNKKLALDVIISDNLNAGFNEIIIPRNVIELNNWYFLFTKLNADDNGAYYTVNLFNYKGNSIINKTINVYNEANNITKLYIDAQIYFNNIKAYIYYPTIVFGDEEYKNISLNSITGNKHCENYDRDLECVKCVEFYMLNDKKECVEDSSNFFSYVFNYIQSDDSNSKLIQINSSEWSFGFNFRILTHWIDNISENIKVLSLNTSSKKIPIISISHNNNLEYDINFLNNNLKFNIADINNEYFKFVITYTNNICKIYFESSLNSNINNEETYISEQPHSLELFDLNKNINYLEAFNGKTYHYMLSEEIIYSILKTNIKELDPLCIDGNYLTGICNNCFDGTSSKNKCNTKSFGLSLVQNFDQAINKDNTYKLNDKLKNTLNSTKYAVTTKFIIYNLPTKEIYSIIRLKNKVFSSLSKSIDINLIDLSVFRDVNNNLSIRIYLNKKNDVIDVDATKINIVYGQWVYFFGYIDLTVNTFTFYIQSGDSVYNQTLKINNYQDKLQNFGELIVLNNNNIDVDNLEFICEASHSYVIPNINDDITKFIDVFGTKNCFLPSICKPLLNCKYTTCKNETNESICALCNKNFVLINEKCVSK